MIKEITIFFPDGNKSFFRVGEFLFNVDEGGERKKTNIKVKKIVLGENEKFCEVHLSNKEYYTYTDFPFCFTSSI